MQFFMSNNILYSRIRSKLPENRVSWEKIEFQGEKNRVSGFLVKSSFPRNAQKKPDHILSQDYFHLTLIYIVRRGVLT